MATNLGSRQFDGATHAVKSDEPTAVHRLIGWARAVLAAALAWMLLEGANWAVRDCSTGPDASDNCLWLDVRGRFGWPQSKLLRTGVLEAVGLAILAGLYLTFRYVWPRRKGLASRRNLESAQTNPEGPLAVESVVEIERRVLRALCLGTRDGSVKDLARSELDGYSWREAAHQALFDVVMSFPASNAPLLSEQLPARLTRRGFPDFDIATFFAPPESSREEVGQWMHQLRELSG